MELINEFTVHLPVEHTWALLTDLERIAPCMPGAQLEEVEGEEYRGVVKVKVGPITAQYKGSATFTARDDTGHVAVLRAEGRDTRGQGNAAATITATVSAAGEDSHVRVVTDLTVTGKVAQFGRNVLGDVSAKLLTQFVDRLEADLALTGAEPTTRPATPGPASAHEPVRRIDSPAAEPVDLLATAGPTLVRPVVGLSVLLLAVLWLLGRRRAR
jgi:carbon monoxide dehydrogenase subunit G